MTKPAPRVTELRPENLAPCVPVAEAFAPLPPALREIAHEDHRAASVRDAIGGSLLALGGSALFVYVAQWMLFRRFGSNGGEELITMLLATAAMLGGAWLIVSAWRQRARGIYRGLRGDAEVCWIYASYHGSRRNPQARLVFGTTDRVLVHVPLGPNRRPNDVIARLAAHHPRAITGWDARIGDVFAADPARLLRAA